tara:strand:- start:317 stop:1126 length:810 start_codon:yes stop_codon:yes gene_type:complete
MKKLSKRIVKSELFEKFIIFIILTNCFFIGVETYFTNSTIELIQLSALIIFIIEIVIRYNASNSIKDYFSRGWNVFDFSIVLICLIPESLFTNTVIISTLRVLRVFRVIRLLKSNDEIKLIVSVLVKSLNALYYNFIFFLIFMYLFGIIGVTLFKLPEETIQNKKNFIELYELAPNSPKISPDPYGNLSETMFTLFRILTGEDWTDLRYNLTIANEKDLISTPKWMITFYHVLWYIISAFLLLNLLVGAILNNYQIIMDKNSKLKNQEK